MTCPPDWTPPITKGIDSISLHALTREDFAGSLAFFLEAAEEEPQEPDVWFRVALCYEKMGDRARAAEHYKKAIELKPDFAAALNNLGAIYISEKKFEEAVRVLAEAVKARPDYAAAYANLAVACIEAKNWKGAADAARKAIALNESDAESHLNLGVASLRTGDRAEALRQHEILLKLDRPRADRLKALLDEKPSE